MKGYKVFNPDWTCIGMQYTCPGIFEVNGELELCRNGIHFCKNAADCFNYYSFDAKNHVAEVIAHGEVIMSSDDTKPKCCTNKLEIIREIPWEEVLRLCNTGNFNTGYRNTGYWNTGCFNRKTPFLTMFDKPSDWVAVDWMRSPAREIMSYAPSTIEWVALEAMSSCEKSEHPEATTVGGYFKALEDKEFRVKRQAWWDSLSSAKKDIVMSLPNFDADIFLSITGINVKEHY